LTVVALFLSRGCLCFSSDSALLPSFCLCYVIFLFQTVFSPLMVVLLLSTMTPDGCCGGDEEGWRWWPCFYPLVASVFL
jgi:hypothetical protein